MNSFDTAYLDILGDIMDNGVRKGDRTGTGTLSRFGTQARFNLKDNRLPLLSLRKVFHRSFIHETLWFLSGSTDIQYLKENNVSIWDSWVKPGTERYRELTMKERCELLSLKGEEAINQFADHVLEVRGSDNMKPLTEDIENQHHAFMDTLEIPRTVLSGGSIGTGAYGSQWRAWEDTRIVQKNEVPQYLEKGYRFIGDLTYGGCSVVQRKIDQIANVVKHLKENPDSRRILLVAYNPAKVDDCQLPPCHSLVQWWSRELTLEERIELYVAKHGDPGSEINHQWLTGQGIAERALSCMLYMRSSDYPVGAVFNIPQYALLTHMLAHVTGMVAEELVFTGADTHAYSDQIDGVLELLQREGYEAEARVHLNPAITDIDDFVFEDIEVTSYEHDGVIRFPVAV